MRLPWGGRTLGAAGGIPKTVRRDSNYKDKHPLRHIVPSSVGLNILICRPHMWK